MKAFQAEGFWFLPGESQREVAGTLHYSPRRGLRLSLIGTLSDHRGFGASEEFPIIHGVVGKSPFGRRVTLVDCCESRGIVTMPGLVSQEVVANKAYIGQEFLVSEADFRFDSARIHLRELNDWFPVSGISRERQGDKEDDFELRIQYRRPELLRLELGEVKATIGMAWKSSFGRHAVSVRERVGMVLEGLGGLRFEHIAANYVRPLRDFFSLVTYAPSSLTSVALGHAAQPREGREEKQYFEVLFQPIGGGLRRSGRQSDPGELLRYEEVRVDLPAMLDRWINFHAEYRPFCHAFFGPLYSPPPFVQTRFLAMIEAMVLYFAKAMPPDNATAGALERLRKEVEVQDALPQLVGERGREWIADALPTEAELSMPRNLLAAMNQHVALMGDLVGGDPEGFVGRISATRRFLLHSDRPESAAPLRGKALYWATEKLRVLMTACVLGQLGLPIPHVAQVFRRNRAYQHLLSVT